MSVSAETAPKCFEMPRRLRTSSPRSARAVGLSVIEEMQYEFAEGPGTRAGSGGQSRARSVRDAELLAAVGIAAGAQLLGAGDALVDDLGLEVLRRHDRGREQ